MNLVDLIGIIPTIFSIILAGLENMKIIGQARKFFLHSLDIGLDMDMDRNRLLLSDWKAHPRQARLWELCEWWGFSASSEWLVYYIYHIWSYLKCIIVFEVPPHLPYDPPLCWSSKSDLYPASGPTSSSSLSSSWSGLARAWVDPSHRAHHHSRLLQPHFQLWAGRT